jgi:hypothetical protein
MKGVRSLVLLRSDAIALWQPRTLTPALSQREREQHATAVRCFWNGEFLPLLATILPLPLGEGRGEGLPGTMRVKADNA